ncbi:MAG: glycosyltransferase family 4 protein [Fuerstiella sp.]
MKLLLVHRYIRPDTSGYAHMLYLMGRRFAADGHDVTIFSAQPGYNNTYDGPALPTRQEVDGMTVIRIPLLKETKKTLIRRCLNVLIFSVRLLLHSVSQRKAYDLLTVSTFPPVLFAAVARWICFFRKTRYIYHCMDLYPEVAQANQMLPPGMLSKIARWVDVRNCKKAAAVVVLSEEMKSTLERRDLSTANVRVINNFVIDEVDPEVEVPEALRSKKDHFRVVFAGNMGRFQSLETLVDAALSLQSYDDIQFLFIGAGVMYDELQKRVEERAGRNIAFHPFVPIQVAMSVMSQSELGVVSLAPRIIQCAYPSKTMSYLEAGCQILAIVEPSTLATFIKDEHLGDACQPNSAQAAADAIKVCYDSWKNQTVDRQQIRKIGRLHFSQKTILGKWTELLGEFIPADSSR